MGGARMVFGMAVPKPDPSRPAKRFAECVLPMHVPEGQPGAGAAELRAALGLAADVQESTADGVLEGWPPESDFVHLWRINMLLEGGRGDSYDIWLDWSAAPCCPLRQRGLMMDFVAALRRSGPRAGGRRPRRAGAG